MNFGEETEKYQIKNSKEKKFLSNLGEEIGLLFQLADDFIDIISEIVALFTSSLLFKLHRQKVQAYQNY